MKREGGGKRCYGGWSRALAGLLALAAACVGTRQDFVDRDDQGQLGRRVEVSLEGVESVEPWVLLDRVEKTMLELSREPTREALVERAGREIADLYRLAGFADVKVSSRLERDGDALRARFTVVEGVMVVVGELSLSGNKSIPTLDLLAHWRQRPSGVLGLGEPLFVEADLAALAEALRAHYQSQGYLRARIDGPRVDRGADGKRATVAYTVTEGPLYHLRSVKLSPALERALPPTRPEPPKDLPFSSEAVEPYLRALRNDLRELGHPEPVLRVALGEDSAKNAVDVLVDGEPGRLVRIVEIEVRGNRSVRTSKILGRVELVAGEPFRGDLEDRTRRALLESGDFTDVRVLYEPVGAVAPVETGSPQDCRAVIVVHEPEQRGLGFRYGYDSWEMLWGEVRLLEPDLLATGIDAKLLGRLDFKGWRGTGTLALPVFAEGGAIETGFTFWERSRPSYRDEGFGGFTALALPLSGTLTSRVGYAFDVHDTLVEATDPAAARTDFDTSRLFAELAHDDRDRLVLPRSGHREALRVSWADRVLGGDVELFETQALAEAHLPVLERLTLSARAELGLVWAGDGSQSLPLPLRQWNGGQRSVRSYREDKLGPKDAFGNPVGGEFRNLLSLEARYAIRWPLEVALFLDAGNAGAEVERWSLDDMGYAIGAGLSYAVEHLGPLRLDAAVNPDPDPGERDWTVHFSLGLPF